MSTQSQNDITLSIIIVNWNTRQLLLDCLASLQVHKPAVSLEIIVVDNASTDGSVAAVRNAFPDVQIMVNPANWGFARANNAALQRMRGRYAVLLNSDTVMKETTLQGLTDFMEQNPDAGVCGPQLLNADGSHQKSTGKFPRLVTEFVSKKIVNLIAPITPDGSGRGTAHHEPNRVPVDFVLGACMMVRKKAIETTGMLDEDYFFLYEEIDWCYRMHQKGWRVYYFPAVSLYHLGGQSMRDINLRARVESWRSRYLFFKKSMHLTGLGWFGVLSLGIMQCAYQFVLYGLLNAVTLLSQKRLRRRWEMFAYLLIWHLRGRPLSMGIPR